MPVYKGLKSAQDNRRQLTSLEPSQGAGPLNARAITVDGVRDEYPGAHDAEERGDCFQHGNHPKAQRPDLTARRPAQSKGFAKETKFRTTMVI